MIDSYKNDVERIQRLMVSIKADFNKRDQKKSSNQPVAMIEGEIRGQLTNLDRELDLFTQVINNQEKNQTQNNLLQREVEKRRNQYTEFVNQKNELKAKFNDSIQQAKDKLFLDAKQGGTTVQSFNFLISQANKSQPNLDLGMMTNKELYKNQKDLESQQDAQLDRVNEKLTTIKYTGQAMNENIKQQNKMLDQVNIDVDQTTKQMMKTNSKLKKFIATSSNTCLIIFILLEIIVLVLVSIYL